jgi:hypothetical protein
MGKIFFRPSVGRRRWQIPEIRARPSDSLDSRKIKADKAPDQVAHSGALSAINGTYGFLKMKPYLQKESRVLSHQTDVLVASVQTGHLSKP